MSNALRNALRSTPSAQRPAQDLPRARTSPRHRTGFTLFELLAVLTVVGIGLVLLLGAYGTWGTAHALTGAERVLESGLNQARTLARARNAFVGVEYGTVQTNAVTTAAGFQLYLCTNENAEVASALAALQSSQPPTESQTDDLLRSLGVSPAAPYQRLSSYVNLAYQPDSPVGAPAEPTGVLFFRPDGSVWSAVDQRCHYLLLSTKSLFNKAPLSRILRVDLATGLVTVLKREVTP